MRQEELKSMRYQDQEVLGTTEVGAAVVEVLIVINGKGEADLETREVNNHHHHLHVAILRTNRGEMMGCQREQSIVNFV